MDNIILAPSLSLRYKDSHLLRGENGRLKFSREKGRLSGLHFTRPYSAVDLEASRLLTRGLKNLPPAAPAPLTSNFWLV